MAPRTITNPAPQTASARAALAAFHCALCGKGYARQNEFAAHEASYEHNHNKRRADLRRMNSAMSAAGRSDADKDGSGGIIRIQLGAAAGKRDGAAGGGGKGFKKSGFKSIGGAAEPAKPDGEAAGEGAVVGSRDEMEDVDDGYELYDPRHPTGCGPECRSRR